MNEKLLSAKDIFLKYAGDPYLMEREGELDGYRALGATTTEEQAWAKEHEMAVIGHFDQAGVVDSAVITFMKLVKRFESNEAFLAFLWTIERKARSLDTFTKLRLCEELLDAASSLEKEENADRNTLQRARAVAFNLVQMAEREPITVSPYYRTVPHLPDALDDTRLHQRISRLATAVGLCRMVMKERVMKITKSLLDSALSRRTEQGLAVFRGALELLENADSRDETMTILSKLNKALVGIEAHGHLTLDEFRLVKELRDIEAGS